MKKIRKFLSNLFHSDLFPVTLFTLSSLSISGGILISGLLPFSDISWLFQGLLVNGTFSLISIPFSNKAIRNSIFRRKKIRITEAFEEFETLCLQQLIKGKKIVKEEFNNKLFIIATKHDLEIKDLFSDEKQFFQRLAKSIIDNNLIDEKTKEYIVYQIRNNNILVDSGEDDTINLYDESNNISSPNYSDINDEEDNDKIKDDNICEEEEKDNVEDDDIKLSQTDQKNIFKQTSIVTGIIFISLFIFISFAQLIFKSFGVNAIILVNTITALIFVSPIFINGIIHFEEFDEHSRRNFYLLLICLLFIIANLICIFSILLE